MWHLYVIIAMLTAAIVLKVANPLRGRGRHGHGGAVAAADRRLMRVLVALVPAVSLPLYLLAGSPDLPGRPIMFTDLQELETRQAALLIQRPLETLMKRDPGNVGAMVRMAEIYGRLGHYPEAIRLMQRATLLAQRQNEPMARIYAESLGRLQVRANHGVVGTDALGSFALARSMKDADPIARYYQALAKAQKGDIQGAIDDWNILLSQGAALSYWKKHVREAIAAAKAGRITSTSLDLP
jgi:cytochrome c-type biogenesis protein CcmH